LNSRISIIHILYAFYGYDACSALAHRENARLGAMRTPRRGQKLDPPSSCRKEVLSA
jgi:hypothetical protein